MAVQNGAVASEKSKDKKTRGELKLPPSIDPAIAEQLVEQAEADGVDLVGPNGLLGQLTKQILENGLEVEMDGHLGYENSRSRAGTVVTHGTGRVPKR